MSIQVFQIKPNPFGRDKGSHGATSSLLAGEWVDIKNVGTYIEILTGEIIKHKAYDAKENWSWELVYQFPAATLSPSEVLRLHSGKGPESVLSAEDRVGASEHHFTGRDRYVWNNHAKGDSVRIESADAQSVIDEASYGSKPLDGDILQRTDADLLI